MSDWHSVVWLAIGALATMFVVLLAVAVAVVRGVIDLWRES